MPKSKFEEIYRDLKHHVEQGDYLYSELLPSENTLIADQMESLEGMKYLTYLEKFEATMEVAEILALEMENND